MPYFKIAVGLLLSFVVGIGCRLTHPRAFAASTERGASCIDDELRLLAG